MAVLRLWPMVFVTTANATKIAKNRPSWITNRQPERRRRCWGFQKIALMPFMSPGSSRRVVALRPRRSLLRTDLTSAPGGLAEMPAFERRLHPHVAPRLSLVARVSPAPPCAEDSAEPAEASRL